MESVGEKIFGDFSVKFLLKKITHYKAELIERKKKFVVNMYFIYFLVLQIDKVKNHNQAARTFVTFIPL